MDFVLTDVGWVNMAHVRSIRLLRRGSVVYARFLDAEDRTVGISERPWAVERPQIVGKLVPAASDTTATLVTVRHSLGRPALADIVTTVVPVIAWRIDNGTAEPVLPNTPAANQTVLMHMPEGELTDQAADMEYATIDAAKQAMLDAAQDRWDARCCEVAV